MNTTTTNTYTLEFTRDEMLLVMAGLVKEMNMAYGELASPYGIVESAQRPFWRDRFDNSAALMNRVSDMLYGKKED